MAWNEPPKNGGNQPPDLDEALQKLQQKFKKMFGGKSTGSATPGSSIGLGLVALVLIVLWALSGIYIVRPAEQAVVLRFGKYVSTEQPGPHWLPRFIEHQTTLNVQKVENFSYSSQMLTSDQNIVSVALAVQFRINNPRDYLFNLVNPAGSLKQATASALRQVIGHTTLDQVLTTGRSKVRSDVLVQLEKIMKAYNAGIQITDVVMQPAKAPEEVKAAFDDAIKAQEDEQRFINQAQAYARGVEPIAKGNAKRIEQEADAYRQQQVLKATGDVSRYLAVFKQYEKAPQVTRERLYIDAMQNVMMNSHKVLLDVKSGSNLMYLPLDRLMSGNVTGTKTRASQSTAGTRDDSEALKQIADAYRASQQQITEGSRQGRDSYRGRGN